MLSEYTKTTFMKKDKEFHANMEHHTRHVARYGSDPSRHVVEHMEALLDSDLNQGNKTLGKWFVACVLDALLLYKDPVTGKGIALDRISNEVDVQTGKDARVHILIKPTRRKGKAYFLFLTRSMRERWKGHDRAAIIASFVERTPLAGTEDYVAALIFHRERVSDDLEKVRKQAAKRIKQVHSIHEICSVLDQKAMSDLFHRISEQ